MTYAALMNEVRPELIKLPRVILQLEVHWGLFNKAKLKRLKSDFLSFLKMAELPKAESTDLDLPNRVVKS